MAYNGFLTTIGRSLLASSNGNSDRLIIDKMGVGDGSIPPTQASLTLTNEIYRDNVLSVVVNNDTFTVKFSVPANVLSSGSGFTVREVGVYGHLESNPSVDVLIAAAEFPESYKPDYLNEGAAKSFIIEAKFLVLGDLTSNIQPYMDPNVAYVSEDDLENYYPKQEVDILIADVKDQCYNCGQDRYTKSETDSKLAEYTKTSELDEFLKDEVIDKLHVMQFEAGEELKKGDPVKIKLVKNEIGEYRPVVVKTKMERSEPREIFRWVDDKVITTNNVATYYNEEDNKFFIAYGELLSKEFRLDYFELVDDPVEGDIFVKRDRWVLANQGTPDTPVEIGNEFRNLKIIYSPDLDRYVLFFDYNPYIDKEWSDMATTFSYWKSLVFFTNSVTKKFENTSVQTLSGPTNTPMNSDDWGVHIVRKKCYAISTDSNYILMSEERQNDSTVAFSLIRTASLDDTSNTINIIDVDNINNTIITDMYYTSNNKFIATFVDVNFWADVKSEFDNNLLKSFLDGKSDVPVYNTSYVVKRLDSKYSQTYIHTLTNSMFVISINGTNGEYDSIYHDYTSHFRGFKDVIGLSVNKINNEYFLITFNSTRELDFSVNYYIYKINNNNGVISLVTGIYDMVDNDTELDINNINSGTSIITPYLTNHSDITILNDLTGVGKLNRDFNNSVYNLRYSVDFSTTLLDTNGISTLKSASSIDWFRHVYNLDRRITNAGDITMKLYAGFTDEYILIGNVNIDGYDSGPENKYFSIYVRTYSTSTNTSTIYEDTFTIAPHSNIYDVTNLINGTASSSISSSVYHHPFYGKYIQIEYTGTDKVLDMYFSAVLDPAVIDRKYSDALIDFTRPSRNYTITHGLSVEGHIYAKDYDGEFEMYIPGGLSDKDIVEIMLSYRTDLVYYNTQMSGNGTLTFYINPKYSLFYKDNVNKHCFNSIVDLEEYTYFGVKKHPSDINDHFMYYYYSEHDRDNNNIKNALFATSTNFTSHMPIVSMDPINPKYGFCSNLFMHSDEAYVEGSHNVCLYKKSAASHIPNDLNHTIDFNILSDFMVEYFNEHLRNNPVDPDWVLVPEALHVGIDVDFAYFNNIKYIKDDNKYYNINPYSMNNINVEYDLDKFIKIVVNGDYIYNGGLKQYMNEIYFNIDGDSMHMSRIIDYRNIKMLMLNNTVKNTILTTDIKNMIESTNNIRGFNNTSFTINYGRDIIRKRSSIFFNNGNIDLLFNELFTIKDSLILFNNEYIDFIPYIDSGVLLYPSYEYFNNNESYKNIGFSLNNNAKGDICNIIVPSSTFINDININVDKIPGVIYYYDSKVGLFSFFKILGYSTSTLCLNDNIYVKL